MATTTGRVSMGVAAGNRDARLPGPRWLRVAIPVLGTLVMGMAAVGKFFPNEEALAGMQAMGIEPSWLPVLGSMILGLLVLYWIPRTAFYGTVLITAYLGGAACVHLMFAKNSPGFPVGLAVLLWAGWAYRFPAAFRALHRN